jgi:hypothetical protein
MAKKLTTKGITTEDVLRVVGDGATFAKMARDLGLTAKTDRVLDRALQRERRAGRVRFDKAERLWLKTGEEPAPKPKRGARKA